MSTAVTTTNANAGAVSAGGDRIEVTLGKMLEKFRSVLPANIPAERFCRVAINALLDPRVAEAAQTYEGQQSILTEVQTAATDGLLLDKREAFLNVYRTEVALYDGGKGYRQIVKYMPMYQGLMKLARNSGVISDIKCAVVMSLDTFAVDMMPPPRICQITHQFPENAFERGDVRGVYACALYFDGTWSNAEVMSVADVNKIRSISPAKDKDAWSKHWNEMARKTVIRRLTKYLPKSTDGMERLHNAASRGDDLKLIQGVTATDAAPRKVMMADKLLAPKQAQLQPPPPPPPQEPKQEQKPAEQPAAKTKDAKPDAQAKQSARKKEPSPPPQEDDSLAGFDERDGGDNSDV